MRQLYVLLIALGFTLNAIGLSFKSVCERSPSVRQALEHLLLSMPCGQISEQHLQIGVSVHVTEAGLLPYDFQGFSKGSIHVHAHKSLDLVPQLFSGANPFSVSVRAQDTLNVEQQSFADLRTFEVIVSGENDVSQSPIGKISRRAFEGLSATLLKVIAPFNTGFEMEEGAFGNTQVEELFLTNVFRDELLPGNLFNGSNISKLHIVGRISKLHKDVFVGAKIGVVYMNTYFSTAPGPLIQQYLKSRYPNIVFIFSRYPIPERATFATQASK